MTVAIRQIGPCLAGEVSGIDMRQPLHAAGSGGDPCRHGPIRGAGVPRPEDRRRAAARLHPQPRRDRAGAATPACARPTSTGLPTTFADVSNLDKNNRPFARDDRRRLFAIGNRLWHSDSSFKETPAKYSLLHARRIPSKGGNTEFADMRAAYDALDAETKAICEPLVCEHCQIYLAPADRLFRPQRRGARALRAGAPSAGAHPSGDRAQVAVSGLACRRHRRLADARGARLPARPDRARDPARVRLYAQMARSATS